MPYPIISVLSDLIWLNSVYNFVVFSLALNNSCFVYWRISDSLWVLTAGSEEDVVVDGATWERKSEGVGGGRDGLPFLRRWGSSVAKWGSELMAERGR